MNQSRTGQPTQQADGTVLSGGAFASGKKAAPTGSLETGRTPVLNPARPGTYEGEPFEYMLLTEANAQAALEFSGGTLDTELDEGMIEVGSVQWWPGNVGLMRADGSFEVTSLNMVRSHATSTDGLPEISPVQPIVQVEGGTAVRFVGGTYTSNATYAERAYLESLGREVVTLDRSYGVHCDRAGKTVQIGTGKIVLTRNDGRIEIHDDETFARL